MRVITGEAKGRPLRFPKGTGIRPATDLVKGAIFSILENIPGDWDRVLDLFSGSGGLGIEALSRGAGRVDFVDRDPRCCAIIKENLEKTKLAARAHVHCTSVENALTLLDKEYNIVLMDPPYADPSIDNLLEQIGKSKLIGKTTTLVVTHSSRRTLSPNYASLKLLKEHRHGDSCIAVYKKEQSL